MTDQAAAFSRYLPADDAARQWGWRLIDAGHQRTPPGSAYPLTGHPLAYLFDQEGKRTLTEYQIVHIISGKGYFESELQAMTEVHAGDAFIVFPGVWHRYGPDRETGWDEYWVGFDGRDAGRLMREFFEAKKPLFRKTMSTELVDLFGRQLDWLRHPRPGSEQVAASLIPQQLALLRMNRLTESTPQRHGGELVIQAKAAILAHLSGRTDFGELAAELGVSYTRFRKRFRAHTGYAPREYENMLKLNRAHSLLHTGQQSVGAVAEALGYHSVHYFSRAFKKQFGFPPSSAKSRS